MLLGRRCFKRLKKYRASSDHMEAGGVAAAVLSESGKVYTGVCVDTACTLGVCAERNALFNMITNGESKILHKFYLLVIL